jgi:hypothetical protein
LNKKSPSKYFPTKRYYMFTKLFTFLAAIAPPAPELAQALNLVLH